MKVSLIGRDFECLVSESDNEDCKAAHIVPYSRPDVSASRGDRCKL